MAGVSSVSHGGKPPHAGGPHKAKALPPGLQGKQLPPGNPWSKLAAQMQQQQGQAQPAAAGGTGLDATA